MEADRLAPVAARANSLIRASTGNPIQLCPRPTIRFSRFSEIRISADFDGRPFEHDTDELVIEALRGK